jgi:hypothetical protein
MRRALLHLAFALAAAAMFMEWMMTLALLLEVMTVQHPLQELEADGVVFDD